MEPFSKREDQQPSLVERSLRSIAGIGVGFGAYWTFKNKYGSLRKNIFESPMADGVKRSFQRHFSFSNVAQEMTEFEKRLGIKSFIELIPPKPDIDREIDALERKRRQISDSLGRAQRTILRVEEVASAEGVDPRIIGQFKSTFEDFRDNYLQRAVGTAETLMGEEFAGKGQQMHDDALRALRWDQIQELNNQMTVVLDRVRVMQHRLDTLRSDVSSVSRSSIRRVDRELAGQDLTKNKVSDFKEAARNIERSMTATAQDIKGLSDLATTAQPLTVSYPMSTRYWTVKTQAADLRREMSLRKMVGEDAYKSLAETVKESYKDQFLGTSSTEVRNKTAEFMKHIRDTVRSLGNSTVTRDGQTFKQFTKIDVAISDELNKTVVIRAKAADPRMFGTDDLVLRYEVPRTQMGIKYLQKNGKDFFVPYSRQNDILSRQAKAYLSRFPWDDPYKMGSAQELSDRINQTVLNNSLMFGKTSLSDLMMSTRIDQRITHDLSKVYESGFENFNKILRNKMARGGILHIDTEFANNKSVPSQIGWVLKDALGRDIDGYHFIIGKGESAPAHLIGKKMGGHDIVRHIDEGQIGEVIDALSRNMNDARLHGHPIQIAGKNFGGAESSTIEALCRLAESKKIGGSARIAMIRSAIQAETVIDVNTIGAVTGDVVNIKGAHLFRLIRDQVGNDPDLKKMVESKLISIGIPGLSEAGQEVFEKGLHTAFQDAYMQGLFPEVMYLALRKQINHRDAGFTKSFQAELDEVRRGFIPKRFLGGLIDVDKFNAVRHEFMRGVSPSSWLKGSLDPTDSNLAGWFPDLRPGRGDRTVFSMGTKDFGRASVVRRLRRQLLQQGKYLDPALAMKQTMNDVQTKMLVMLDAGQTNVIGKEEFLMADRMRRLTFSDPYVEVVDKLDRNIKVGTEVGYGAGRFSVIGHKGGQVIQFRGLDKASTGVIREITTLPNGQLSLNIDRIVKPGRNTPVLGPQAGLIGGSLEEVFPNVGPKFGFATASSYMDKTNPGLMMTDMFSFLFEFAGTDPKKKAAVYSAFRKRLRQKSGDMLKPEFFPLTEHFGTITFSDGNMDFWREMNKRIDIGDYVHIAEDVNMQLGGAFVPTRIILDKVKPQRKPLLEITNGVLFAHGKMMNNRSALEANVAIAMGNLRRETNPNEVTRIVDQAIGMLGKDTPEAIFEAMKLTRPDVVSSLKAEGKAITPENFFDKVPSYGGFTKTKYGNYVFSTVRHGPINFSNIEVFSGIGTIKKGYYGFNFIEAARNLQGSEDLVDHLVKTMYDQNAITLSRMFPHAPSTGNAKTPPWMQLKSAGETAKILDKWIRMPNSGNAARQGWSPMVQLYEVNGVLLTEDMAVESLGISKLKFGDAVKDGLAKPVSDYSVLKKRMIDPKDLDEIKRLQPFTMEFGRTMGVQVQGSSKLAAFDRLLVTAATDEDYFRLPFKNSKTGETKTFAIEAPHMAKLRELMKCLTGGAYVDPTGKNGLSALHDYVGLLGKRVLKEQMKARIDTMDIPVVRLKAFATTEVDAMAITTKAKAIETIRSTLGVRDVNKSLFMKARGIMPDEGLLAGDNEVMDKIIGSMTWDDARESAKRMLGNVQMGSRTGVAPRSFALRFLGRDIQKMGGKADPYMADALGTLENILSSKGRNDALMKKFKKYASEGVYPVPMLGTKYPLADQSKFVGGWFFRAQASATAKSEWGTGTGRIGFESFNSMVKGNIDADKDIVNFLMSGREKYMKIIKENRFLSAIDPINVVVDTEKGMTTLYNNATGTFSKIPTPMAVGTMGIDKAASMESELITKQFAGQVTTLGENVRHYMRRMLSGTGSQLAHDLGQMDPNKINLQVWEATGAMIEGILKGKAQTSSGETISDMVKNFGDISTFKRFAMDVNDPSHPAHKQFIKLTHKIQGSEHVFAHSGGMSTLDILLESMRSGRGSSDMFSSLVPEEKILGTSLQASKIWGMRGAMIEAMGRLFETQGIPTRFNEIAQEGLIKSFKSSIRNDMGEKTWRGVSKGMGWLAGAGAVYLAANMFNKDGMGMLGQRPGTGTENFDWTFTHPEYQMANLLDVPYNNPYDKKRTYISMDNPMTQNKMERLSRMESRDLVAVHNAVYSDRIRDIVSGPGSRRTNNKQLLERFGHV